MKLTVEQKIRIKKIIEDLENLRKERGEDKLQIAEYNGGSDSGEIYASDKEIQEIMVEGLYVYFRIKFDLIFVVATYQTWSLNFV